MLIMSLSKLKLLIKYTLSYAELKAVRALLMCLMLCATSFAANADWYEATGQAAVRHGDVKSAKNRALQDAIKQTMLFAGANVASVQKMSQGLLIDDYTQIYAQGSVNQIEIIDESYRGNTVSITIRADIFADDEKCYSSEFSKKVAITQFPIQHWQDAKIGNLYGLEKELPRKIAAMFKGSGAIYPIAWLQKKLNVEMDFEQQGRVRHQMLDAVATQANAQFVMIGRISDLSFGDKTNGLMFWQDDLYERFFSMDIIIANALTNEVLYQNRFHTSAEWEYDKREEVNINSRQFWNKQYGKSIEELLADARNDILANLSCQQLQSKILSVRDGEQVHLNIGLGQGVAVGQEYRVSYRADVIDDNGNLLTNFVISPYRVRITQVYENSAIAESLDADFMNNVQVNDVIELKSWDDGW
ncbi:MAG: flagellar assembly protein T N-terminal domain-containing protein [Gammaproteobacteria bacterium]|nr:flagellar assembly protein T N-terminal domain-containing protein [Gammaproteobacteria bacterium]